MKNLKTAYILGAILLLAAALRFYHLDFESLWLDEGNSIRYSSLSLAEFIRQSDVQSPLYFQVLHYWLKVFGDSAVAARVLSVLCGTLVIFMVYKMGKLLFDEATSLTAAFFAAISVLLIQYSQEVRYFSFFTLMVLFSFYFFYKLAQKAEPADCVFYVFFSTMTMYIHSYWVFIIAVQNIYVLTLMTSGRSGKLSLKKWLALQGALAVCYAPWLVIALRQMANVSGRFWLPQPSFQYLLMTFDYFAGSRIALTIMSFLILLAFFNLEINAPGSRFSDFFKGIKNIIRWNRGRGYGGIFLLALWFFLPVFVPFIISLLATPIYHSRYTIISAPAFCLLAAAGIRNIRIRYLQAAFILAVVTFSSMSLKSYYTGPHKEQWRELGQYLESHALPGDIIVVHNGYCLPNILNYYAKRTDLTKLEFPARDEEVKPENIGELEKVLVGPERVWLVVSHRNDPLGLIPQATINSGRFVVRKDFVGIELYLLDKEK
jgi:mannosyltransferase